MLRRLPVLLLLLALLGPSASYGGLFGPSNYDECITDSMKGVSSDVAARAIIESCRNLFPDSAGDAAPPGTPAPQPAAVEADVATPAARPAASVEPAPLDTTGERSLTADELALVRARAKVFGSTYRVMVDNGNTDLTLTEVTIAVWDEGDPAVKREEYSAAVRITPQTAVEVKYTVHYRGDESGWNWGVVAARGVD